MTRRRLPATPEPMHLWESRSGLRLAGDAWGHPQAPLVLMLHGLGQTRHAWAGTGRRLGEAGFHAVAVDARGHGDSDWAPDGDYTRDTMMQDLQDLLQAIGGHPAVIMGASMGGATGLVAVGEGHIEARALVLVDLVPRNEAAGVARIRDFMRRSSGGFDTLEAAADAIHAYRPQAGRSVRPEGLAKNLRLDVDGRYRWHWDPRLLDRPRESDERRVACARRLRLPTLLVRGAHSDVVSEEGVRDFLAHCPHAEVLDVAGAGHMVAGDRNDAFGLGALAFLRRTVPVLR